jgi:hypothetical protein
VKQPLNQWVGKPLSQLIQTYGEPNYTSVMKNGRFVYDFVREPQHVGPIPTYQFIVGRNKTITTARLIL